MSECVSVKLRTKSKQNSKKVEKNQNVFKSSNGQVVRVRIKQPDVKRVDLSSSNQGG